MQFLKDLRHIFYPKLCVNCQNQLVNNEFVLCTFCRHDLPLANFKNYTDNKIIRIFYGRVEIEKANALLLFRKKGIVQQIIHELKYKNNEDVGVFLGRWYASILKETSIFSEVDIVIPVPLHPKRLKERGYNQVTKFGLEICNSLKIPFKENILTRVSSTKTQTFKSRFERFTNLDTKFITQKKDRINGKHILLIDDVITTGATLESCAKELLKSGASKISLITMAYTE